MQSSSRGRSVWRFLVRSIIGPALVSAVVTTVLAGAQSTSVEGGISSLERQALGWMLLHRPSRPVDPRIAFVAIDTPLYEETEARELAPLGPRGKPLGSYKPAGCECLLVPRECFARAVKRLHTWGARAVVLDVVFRRSYGPVDKIEDRNLGEALFAANNVVVPAAMTARPLDRSRDPTRTSDLLLDPPVDEVAMNATVGSPRVDPRDQEYAVELLQTAHNSEGGLDDYFSMPYLAYCMATKRKTSDLAAWQGRWLEGTVPRLFGGELSVRPTEAQARSASDGGVDLQVEGDVIVDEAFYQKRLMINFAVGADPAAGRFRPVRLSWLLSCPDAEGRKLFHNKIVLVGDPARDLHRTVVGALPGTEVLAHTVQTLLQDSPIVPVPAAVVLGLMFGASFLAATFIRQFPAILAAVLTAGLLVGLLALGAELMRRDLWLLVVSPALAVLVTSTVMFCLVSKLGQGLVARLVPRGISRTLEGVGGFRFEEGTVLLSDIRGYSTFSEYVDPCETMARLNAYFARVHTVLARYDGHFIKSPGDCVVAWFGPERRGAPHPERAIRAGLDLIAEAARFGAEWASADGTPFEVGVGVNTGPMAVGVLDAARHIEPTVIGDTVNLCSRIEALTKDYGTPLIVSESSLEPVRDRFRAELLGDARVKGREQSVRIYAVSGLADGVPRELKPPPWWKRIRRRPPRESSPVTPTASNPIEGRDMASDERLDEVISPEPESLSAGKK